MIIRLNRRELRKIQIMVEHLSSVIEYSSLRVSYYLLQRHRFKLSAGHQFIEIIDIGLQMFTIVILNGFSTNHRF